MFEPGDIVAVSFPGVVGVKRQPAVVLSSATYHAARPDVIVGLVTSRTVDIGPTGIALGDRAAAGLRLPSVFRSFLVTRPPSARPSLVGHLSARDWAGVQRCVQMALAVRPARDAPTA